MTRPLHIVCEHKAKVFVCLCSGNSVVVVQGICILRWRMAAPKRQNYGFLEVYAHPTIRQPRTKLRERILKYDVIIRSNYVVEYTVVGVETKMGLNIAGKVIYKYQK